LPASSAKRSGRLAGLVTANGQRGVGMPLVEHQTDLIFDMCQHVTVLNLGQVDDQGQM
jgi:branched-chain amino acid transport system permease protein